jgi:hypothetical protein
VLRVGNDIISWAGILIATAFLNYYFILNHYDSKRVDTSFKHRYVFTSDDLRYLKIATVNDHSELGALMSSLCANGETPFFLLGPGRDYNITISSEYFQTYARKSRLMLAGQTHNLCGDVSHFIYVFPVRLVYVPRSH